MGQSVSHRAAPERSGATERVPEIRPAEGPVYRVAKRNPA